MTDSVFALGRLVGLAFLYVGVVVVTTLIVRATWRSGSSQKAALPRAATSRLSLIIGIVLFVLAAAVLVTTVVMVAF